MTDHLPEITAHWNLPQSYLDYLKLHPNKGEFVDNENFINGLTLYGAAELIKNQEGYSYNPIKKQAIPDWPVNLVVIADDGGDPFVIDLSTKVNGRDNPVLFAYHGEGDWDFQFYAPSFTEFLTKIKTT